MIKEEIQQYLLETIQDVAKGVLEKTNYAELKKCKVKMVGPFGATFQVEYKGQLYTAYPAHTGAFYKEDTLVYVLFSNNRTDDRKFIIGVADEYSIEEDDSEISFDPDITVPITFHSSAYFKDKVFIEDKISINKVNGIGGEITVESPIRMDNNSTIFGKSSRTSWSLAMSPLDGGMLAFKDVATDQAYDAIINTRTYDGNSISFGRIGRSMGFYGLNSEHLNQHVNPDMTLAVYRQSGEWWLDSSPGIWAQKGITLAGGELTQGGVVQPYLMQSRTNAPAGQWNYEKWSNGKLECWLTSTGFEFSSFFQWGGIYISGNFYTPPNYPVAFDGTYPVVNCNIREGTMDTAQVIKWGNAWTSEAGSFRLIRGGATSGSLWHEIVIHAIGRWK